MKKLLALFVLGACSQEVVIDKEIEGYVNYLRNYTEIDYSVRVVDYPKSEKPSVLGRCIKNRTGDTTIYIKRSLLSSSDDTLLVLTHEVGHCSHSIEHVEQDNFDDGCVKHIMMPYLNIGLKCFEKYKDMYLKQMTGG